MQAARRGERHRPEGTQGGRAGPGRLRTAEAAAARRAAGGSEKAPERGGGTRAAPLGFEDGGPGRTGEAPRPRPLTRRPPPPEEAAPPQLPKPRL